MTANVWLKTILPMIEMEAAHGPIDLFCSNAGIGGGADEQSPLNWQNCWDVTLCRLCGASLVR